MSDVEDLAATLQLVLAQGFSPLDENWQCEKFTTLSEPSVKYLLSSDDLIVQSENTVFHALMHWMKQNNIDPAGLEETNDLLAVVRFKLVKIDYHYNVIKNHPIALKMPKFHELYLSGMTYNAIPPTQKKLLEEQPVLKKKPERDIIQYTLVIKKEDYEAALGKKTKLCSDEFWACGYQMRLDMLYSHSRYIRNYADTNLDLSLKNKESEVLFKIACGKNRSIMSQHHEERFTLLNSCKNCLEISLMSSDFNNDDNTCKLFVVVEPL